MPLGRVVYTERLSLRYFPRDCAESNHGSRRDWISLAANARCRKVDDHVCAATGVACRKDATVLDEIPMAWKDIEPVMHARRNLAEIVHPLKQLVCVKA